MKESELKNSAPTLFSLKNSKPGFVIPSNYFNAIEDDIEIAMLLKNIDKDNSFSVPKKYFKSIEDSVLLKISEENNALPNDYFDTIEDKVFEKLTNKPSVVPLKQKRNNWYAGMAIAASIALLFTLQLFTSSENLDIASLHSDDIENFISNGDLNINSYQLSNVYNDIEIEYFEISNTYSDEDLLDYLDDINVESLLATN